MPSFSSTGDAVKSRDGGVKNFESAPSTGIEGVDEALLEQQKKSRAQNERVGETLSKVDDVERDVREVDSSKASKLSSGDTSGTDISSRLSSVKSGADTGATLPTSSTDSGETARRVQEAASREAAQQNAMARQQAQQRAMMDAQQRNMLAQQQMRQNAMLQQNLAQQAANQAQQASATTGGSPQQTTTTTTTIGGDDDSLPAGTKKISKKDLMELIEKAQDGNTADSTADGKTIESKGSHYGKLSNKGALSTSEVDLRPIQNAKLSRDEYLRVIDKALENNGITSSEAKAKWVPMLEARLLQESGGQIAAVNKWDSNAVGEIQADGAPAQSSRGLVQTIPSTFAANHVAGTSTNIYDPEANVSAGIRYMMNRYNISADGSGVDTFHAAYANRGY